MRGIQDRRGATQLLGRGRSIVSRTRFRGRSGVEGNDALSPLRTRMLQNGTVPLWPMAGESVVNRQANPKSIR